MKYIFGLLFWFSSTLAAYESAILSDEFAAYHLRVAVEAIENEDVFNLLQENIDNLKMCGSSNAAANELINLIEEGYAIDAFSMAKLIDTLTYANASNNAMKVIIKAIEYKSPLSPEHLSSLIQTLGYANASNNATAVLIAAINHGIPFGPKERILLAQLSTQANAKKNVEKIRKALHERAKS